MWRDSSATIVSMMNSVATIYGAVAGQVSRWVRTAKRWEKASDAAGQAGFRDLGESNEAFFDVKPER